MACDDRFDWQTFACFAGFFDCKPAVGYCRSREIGPGDRFEFPADLRSHSMQNSSFGVHENTGVDANYIEYLFPPPPGITLDESQTTGLRSKGAGTFTMCECWVVGCRSKLVEVQVAREGPVKRR
jgi:hypothetical protein